MSKGNALGAGLLATALFVSAAGLGAQEAATPPLPVTAPEAGEPATTTAVRITRAAELFVEADAPRPALIPAALLAGRSDMRGFAMSPDGRTLAVVRDNAGKTDIMLLDTATRKAIKVYRIDESRKLDWLQWAGNDRYILSVSFPAVVLGIPLRLNRLMVQEAASGKVTELPVSPTALWGGDLVHLAEDGSHALVAVQDDFRETPSVYRYDLVGGTKPQKVVRPRAGVWNWFADNAGVVRLGTGWENKRLKVWYRRDEASEFAMVGKIKQNDDKSRYWNVVQIVSGSDKGYVLEEGESGRVGVRLFDYGTGQPLETFYEHPEWDIDEVWLKPDGTPLAALYTDDRERITWFDDKRARLTADLSKAMGLEDVGIVARSKGGEQMLVWGGNEADPGALYLFAAQERRLHFLANTREGLDQTQLVKPQPVRYRARDGLGITAYLTLPRGREAKNLPLVILPHGGPFGVRDKLRYDDQVQFLANRGYAVLQPNFRGSGGYGEAFFAAGEGEVGRRMQDDLDDAMDWAVGEGIVDPSRVCVVGGSYGGYAALWAVLRNPERYRCAASWAGVTDWDKMLAYDKRYLDSGASKAWQARVRGERSFNLDAVSPYRLAARLSRPVLLAHGKADDNVPFRQFELMVAAAKAAPVPLATLAIDGEGHSFSSPKSEQQWYDALDTFLAKHNPADQVAPDGSFTPPSPPPAERPSPDSVAIRPSHNATIRSEGARSPRPPSSPPASG